MTDIEFINSKRQITTTENERLESEGQETSYVRIHSLWNEILKSTTVRVRTMRFDELLGALGPTTLTAKFRWKHDQDPKDIVHRIIDRYGITPEPKNDDDEKKKSDDNDDDDEDEDDKKKKSKKGKGKKGKGKKGKGKEDDDDDDEDDENKSDSDDDDDDDDKKKKNKKKGKDQEKKDDDVETTDAEILALKDPDFQLILNLLKRILEKYHSMTQLINKDVYDCLRRRWSDPRTAIFFQVIKAHDHRVMKDHERMTISDMDDIIFQARTLRGSQLPDMLKRAVKWVSDHSLFYRD